MFFTWDNLFLLQFCTKSKIVLWIGHCYSDQETIASVHFRFVQTAKITRKPPHIAQMGMYGGLNFR